MGCYNQEIEKLAARRWKRNIGSMDPKDYRRLFDAGVLNIPREIKGLNKGSENIAKRYNAFFEEETWMDVDVTFYILLIDEPLWRFTELYDKWYDAKIKNNANANFMISKPTDKQIEDYINGKEITFE